MKLWRPLVVAGALTWAAGIGQARAQDAAKGQASFGESSSSAQSPSGGQLPAKAEPPESEKSAAVPTSAKPSPAEPSRAAGGRPAGSPGATAAGGAQNSQASPAKSGVAPSGEGDIDAAAYRVRLRDLERRIEALKEQIRRSHTRLSLLSDQIMSGVDGGGRVDIQFDNDLSDAWRIVELVVVLDGVVQYKKSDTTGALSAQEVIPIFNGSLGKGDHVVQVMMKLRGHGFGLFSYLRGLDATVRNDYSFSLSRGKSTEIRVTAWEQGGPTMAAEERPNVRFDEMSTGGKSAPGSRSNSPGTPQDKGAGGSGAGTGKD